MEKKELNTSKVIVWDGVEWILSGQKIDQWYLVQNTVIIFLVSYNGRKMLKGEKYNLAVKDS
jgi:hypothetical protein